MAKVYLNGELVEAADATVSAFDHGLLTGDGVFESVVVHDGVPFFLRRHLDRLERSCAAIGLQAPPREELEEAARAVVASGVGARAKLRLTITGGPGPLGSARGRAGQTVLVAAEELGEPAGPATVVVAPWPRNERGALVGAKTISYAENVVALADALRRGASEALFSNLAGNLCEGTGSNVFVAVDGELVTPPLSAGCLAGVTRSLVLERVPVSERDVPIGALEEAEEAFLTSTTRGVQPIARIGDRQLSACPGPLTAAATRAINALVVAERAGARLAP